MSGAAPAGSFTVGHDHPCLPGHFPGAPLVPGVVLLDEAFARIGEALALAGGWRVERILSAKFRSPVLPGQEVHVFYELAGGGSLAFACRVGDDQVFDGRALLRTAG